MFGPPLCALGLLLAPANEPVNLLRNGDFEAADGWGAIGAPGRYRLVPGVGRDGSVGLVYDNPAGPTPEENSHFDQLVTVEPGLYVASAWFRSDGQLRPALRLAGADWADLATEQAPPSTAWTRVRLLVASPRAQTVRVQIFGGARETVRANAVGRSWCDDVELRPASEADRREFSTARITVHPDRLRGPVDPRFFGTNLLFVWDDDAALADGKLAAALRKLPCRLLRYPGGEMADNYNWRTEQLEFPDRFPNRAGPATTSTDEFISLCRAVDAEPIFVVNLESFTRTDRVEQGAALAAEWVRYVKARDFPVTWWEIGNESDLRGTLDPLTAERYARALVVYAKAMKAVDPTLKIGALGPREPRRLSQNDVAAGTGQAWWPTVVEIAGEWFDFVIVHRYGPPDPAQVEALRELRRWLTERFPDRPPPLALTEWNLNREHPARGPEQAARLAELTAQYLDAGIELACFWPLRIPGDDWSHRALLTWDKSDQTAYHVLGLFARHTGRQLVETTNSQPQVVAQASVDPPAGRTTVMLVNRSGRQEGITVLLEGVPPATPTTLRLAGEGGPVVASASRTGEGWAVELPPHAVVALTWVE